MRWRVLSVIGIIYAVQFIPAIFAFMTLPIIMREAGHSATAIGLVQLVGIPYIFKFLWAPFIDRYAFGRDRYKSWILVLSAIHVAALIVLAFLDPTGPLLPLVICLFVAVAAVATQDIAVDALAISLMRPAERTMGASFQNFGIYAGAVIGGFGFLYLYSKIGWTAALLTQAVIFAVPLITLTLVEEPVRSRKGPPTNLRSVLRFFKQPRMGRWIAILASMKLPLIMITLPIRLMMVDEGMSTEEIALWFGLFAMSAAGGTSLFLGPLLRDIPRVRGIYIVGAVNLILLIAVSGLVAHLPGSVRYTIVIAWAAIALTDVVLFRGSMDKVRPESPGFDFSVQIVILTLAPMLSNPVAGVVYDKVGAQPIFFASVIFALIPLAILRLWVAPFKQSATGFDGEAVKSTGTLRTNSAAMYLDHYEADFTGHGINCTRPEPGLLRIEEMGCRVDIVARDDAMDIQIEAPSDNFMTFLREELVSHLEKAYPEVVGEIRWTGGFEVGALPSNFRILRAVRRKEIFPGLVRVTLSGSDVEALNRDGIHIRLMMPRQHGRKPVWPKVAENGGITWPKGNDKLHARVVTIRNLRLDAQEIDIDVAHHDGGLISRWAVLEDDTHEVGIMGPIADPYLSSTRNVVLAADCTGLPALARLIESVNGEVTGHVFAAAPSQAVLDAYLPSSSLNVKALDPSTFSDKVTDMLQNCEADAVSFAWFAGEFSAAKAARAIFKDKFCLPKEQQSSTAYWRKNVPGHSSRAV